MSPIVEKNRNLPGHGWHLGPTPKLLIPEHGSNVGCATGGNALAETKIAARMKKEEVKCIMEWCWTKAGQFGDGGTGSAKLDLEL